MFEEKDTREESNSVKGAQIATSTVVPQKTTDSPLKRRKQAKVTHQAWPSTPASTARPATTRLPEFVHMPTVKFDFGSSSFPSKGSTRRTETGENKEKTKESHKEKTKQSTWPTGNEISKKDDTILLRQNENEKVRNKIGSSPALIKYGSKARFNDKDDSMFPQAATNRSTCQTTS